MDPRVQSKGLIELFGDRRRRPALGESAALGAQRRECCRPDRRNIGVGGENVVVALSDLRARREDGVGGASSFALNRDIRLRRDTLSQSGPTTTSPAAPSSTAASL